VALILIFILKLYFSLFIKCMGIHRDTHRTCKGGGKMQKGKESNEYRIEGKLHYIRLVY
jgi:hypothetical protein